MNLPVEPRMTEYLYRKAAKGGVPLSGTFELTPLCNLNCKMCYVRIGKEEQERIGPLRTAEQWLKLAEEAKKEGMLYLLLTGGEPFTHPQFLEIYTELHKMGFIISINTNGTMIDEAIVNKIKNYPPSRVNISLYGAANETYKRLCRCEDGFSRTERAVKLLKKEGIQVKLNCSLTPWNKDDLEKIVEFAHKNEVYIQVATYMFPPTRRDTSMIGTNDRFTPEEAAWYTAYSEYLTRGKDAFLDDDDNIPIPLDTDDECFELGGGIRCRAGKCSFWITWDGKMTPCGMFPSDGALNVFENGFSEAWKDLKEKTAQIRLPAKCDNCPALKNCRACAAMVVTESGCFDKIPKYRCNMMAAYPAQRKKIREELL